MNSHSSCSVHLQRLVKHLQAHQRYMSERFGSQILQRWCALQAPVSSFALEQLGSAQVFGARDVDKRKVPDHRYIPAPNDVVRLVDSVTGPSSLWTRRACECPCRSRIMRAASGVVTLDMITPASTLTSSIAALKCVFDLDDVLARQSLIERKREHDVDGVSGFYCA